MECKLERNSEAYSNLIYLIVRNGKKKKHKSLCEADLEALDAVIDSLGKRKSFIVKGWFSLNREKKLKMRELAAIFEITISSIADFKERALRELRKEPNVVIFNNLFS